MESKKSFGKQLERILEGHGFYIVMALCAAIIGVSIWSLFRTPVNPADEAEFDDVLSEVEAMPYDPIAPLITEPPDDENTAEETFSEQLPAAESASEDKVVWPLNGDIQRAYSVDTLQYDETLADWRTHDGIDIAADVGTKVCAVKSGTVVDVRADDLYGTSVVIDHGNGLICTYANLEQVPTVYIGDSVQAGDVIGSVGDTSLCETAQKSHLHFSAKRDGITISPLDFLPQKS